MKRALLVMTLASLVGCAQIPVNPYVGSAPAARDLVSHLMGDPTTLYVSDVDMTHADQIVPVNGSTPDSNGEGYTLCLFILSRDRSTPPYGWLVLGRSTRCDHRNRSFEADKASLGQLYSATSSRF
jgi:hypothetical protein